MTRQKRVTEPPPGLDLTELVSTRVSPEAKRLAHERARVAGLPDATWLRNVLYKTLGLTKE
jgi:hypothetical protein